MRIIRGSNNKFCYFTEVLQRIAILQKTRRLSAALRKLVQRYANLHSVTDIYNFTEIEI